MSVSDEFATVFGSERGQGSIFSRTPSLAAHCHNELCALVQKGELVAPLVALLAGPELAAAPLAADLRERIVTRIIAEADEHCAAGAREVGEITGVRLQQSENVVRSRATRRLHIWPDADQHGALDLADLDSQEIATVCGEPVWSCERVKRGAWSSEPACRCPECAKRAAQVADCSEGLVYAPLDPDGMAELRETLAAHLRELMRRPSANIKHFIERLRAQAGVDYRRHVRALCARRLTHDRARHERLLGVEDYFKLERELQRAGVRQRIEEILGAQDWDELVVEAELHSRFDLSLRAQSRMIERCGLGERYRRGELPRPTWQRHA